ncbi:MAG: cyclic nucleotide-binding domain-containing protein [Planctomycetaceae bacterium]
MHDTTPSMPHDVEDPLDRLVLPEEDGLFARDIDGQLVRMDKVTASDFDKRITIKIDGREVTVPKAVPLTDSQGKILRDAEGLPIPRATTIFDAASKAYADDPDGNPIPILCHQEHLDPVGVCRICCVEIAKVKRGAMQRERKLLPACHHRVEETMEVQTIRSPDLAARRRVDANVRTLVNLLTADHLPKDWRDRLPSNELGQLAERLDALAMEARAIERRIEEDTRPGQPVNESAIAAKWPLTGRQAFAPRSRTRGRDHSSLRSDVDHDQCILCDRCARACSDVKQNFVIGRTGKGYDTRIGFDLDDAMGQSSCVSCGECMITCPTGALVFKEAVGGEQDAASSPSAADLRRHPIFAGVPVKFLKWNSRAVRRRSFVAGETICREGEQASTAFLLLTGRVGVSVGGASAERRAGPLRAVLRKAARWLQGTSGGRNASPPAPRARIQTGGGRALERSGDRWVDEMTPEDVIVGEMSCLNHYPRSATLVAIEPVEAFEIDRNVLHMLQRNVASRSVLDAAYRSRALATELRQLDMFEGLDDADRRTCADMLRDRAELVRVDKGQVIFAQGDVARDFFKVRLGFVKVSQKVRGEERVADYLGPGRTFGEIGLLAAVGALGIENQAALRTASCTALDDVELVRIRGEDFRAVLERFPAVRHSLVERAHGLLERDRTRDAASAEGLGRFLENGLVSAQKLLVLDLESCTRCDECTRACSDTHDGVTRLIREGLRFENFLVASSCRSCLDPYCLVGCPVDAIHRKPREGHPAAVEIVIEDHCIGCGLCSTNCPYGNISMHRDETSRRVATTCDLCRDLVGPNDDPSCVYACPHDAAFRMSGDALLRIVSSRREAAQAASPKPV